MNAQKTSPKLVKQNIEYIINTNYQLQDAKNEFEKMVYQFGWNKSFEYGLKGLMNYIEEASSKTDCVKLKCEMLKSHPEMIEDYFLSIYRKDFIPSDESKIAIDSIINSFEDVSHIIYDILGMYFTDNFTQHFAQNEPNGLWIRTTYTNIIDVPIKDTLYNIFIPYLPQIYDLYHEDLYKKAKRSHIRLFIYYFLFQEYMVDEWQSIINRFASYQDSIQKFILYHSRKMPQEILDKLSALKTLKEIKQSID